MGKVQSVGRGVKPRGDHRSHQIRLAWACWSGSLESERQSEAHRRSFGPSSPIDSRTDRRASVSVLGDVIDRSLMSTFSDQPVHSNIWIQELSRILQGASGGFLFGVPLLYTVELWSIGASTHSPSLLAAIGITFGAVYLLTQTEHFRHQIRSTPALIAVESVEALGLGILAATVALILLRRITVETPLTEALGKIVFEGIPFSLGVVLGQSTLDSQYTQTQTEACSYPDCPHRPPRPWRRNQVGSTLADLDATLTGALIVALNIAPTDEIPLLAGGIPPLWLLLIVGMSLGISYAIVFASGFTNQAERRQQSGLFQEPINETLVAYLVSLLVSMLMLWFFRRLSLADPWQEWLSDTIVLGFPAAIGGAAGRVVI